MAKADKEQKEALDTLKDFSDSAAKEFESFASSKSIELKNEVKDKNGEATKVLVVNRDAPGWISVYARKGLPMAANPLTKQMQTDDDLLFSYMNLMSNVDLEVEENLVAVGFEAIGEARSFVLAFFLLLWGKGLRPENVMVG